MSQKKRPAPKSVQSPSSTPDKAAPVAPSSSVFSKEPKAAPKTTGPDPGGAAAAPAPVKATTRRAPAAKKPAAAKAVTPRAAKTAAEKAPVKRARATKP